MIVKKRIFPVIIGLFVSALSFGQKEPLRLWYDKPAAQWEETLPLGNGRLGLTPDGGVTAEKIVLNDITLWTGAPQDANNYDAYKSLPQIRKYLLEGKNDSAQALVDQSFICKGPGSGGTRYGCFQMLGNLNLGFSYDRVSGSNAPANRGGVQFDHYSRELTLSDAMARCGYRVGGVTYKREYLTSYGDDVAIIRYTADQPGKLNCRITMDRPEKGESSVAGGELDLSGQLDNGIDGKGMSYIARVQTRLKGGSCVADGQALVVKGATELIVYVSMGTDWKGAAYKEVTRQLLAAAMKKTFAQEVKEHVSAYRRLFDRLDLQIGGAEGADIPTDQRLLRFRQDPKADNGLAVLFFQFGRYLSISSTRVGLLPPNLQGLWANQIHTPWNGDYHLDINVEMNHWPVEVTNLSELNLPLADLVAGMVPHGEKTAKAYYNAGGWVAHVITNPWGWTEPGESASWGVTKVGAGWLCDNLWQHYDFTNDLTYLKRIYPILKGAAEFYNDMLIRDPAHGWLVTAPSSSPENTFYMPNGRTASICMGPTIDNQIIRQLFGNVIRASRLLGIDRVFGDSLGKRLEQIPPPGIVAPDGRLQEWLEDYTETDVHHRHVSHLYGLYPAGLITPDSTPALAEACRKTLEARGDDGPSWSIAYKMIWWARLYDGDRAYRLLTEIMKPTLATNINYGAGGGIYPNLLSAGPPFQIDGNFGATAAMAEMLIQSHGGYIHLLPALPEVWKASGKVRGLKARGNFTVDMEWKDGKVVSYKVSSPDHKAVKIKINGILREIKTDRQPVDYVNPFIGASTSAAAGGNFAGLGKTFPGAATPFGMTQLSPNTITGGDNGSGYSYEHKNIEGFAMTQMSGVGWYGDLGNFLVTPSVGTLKTSAAGYRSEYDKKSETASAGYYAVTLKRGSIRCEMTAAPHSGIMRFTFPAAGASRIQIDLARRVGGTSVLQYVKLVNDSTLEGWMKCTPDGGGWGDGAGHANYTMYFCARCSKPFRRFGVWSADVPERRKLEDVTSAAYQEIVAHAEQLPGVMEKEGRHLGFYTEFATKKDEPVLLKTGISFVSMEGASHNLDEEIGDFDFDRIHQQARDSWNKALSVITVGGASEEEKTCFYTALYHTLLDPRICEDVDGNYPGGDGLPHHATDFTKRTIFSGWDVFRSQMPLQTMINPRVVIDLINSLVTLAEENGKGYFDRWELLNAYSGCMVGNPAISVVADAYVKGLGGFDASRAREISIATAERFGNGSRGFSGGENSISNTLEYAYSDWCLSQLSAGLGHKEDAKKYYQRGQDYKNVFDKEKSWFRPRREDGSWEAWPAKGRLAEGYGTVESNPYQQGWFVPQDIPGMIALMGGKEKVLADLESFFKKTPENMLWNEYYNHANEPVHHVAFLFNYLGAPWLTQQWTRLICHRAYHNTVEGLVGNDDVGQMSAWYVLAASGLYPVCPGSTRYEITSPVFDTITMRTGTGKTFRVVARNNSPSAIYIQGARLNGKRYDKCFIGYHDIMAGGELELTMGEKPSKTWGL